MLFLIEIDTRDKKKSCPQKQSLHNFKRKYIIRMKNNV